MSCHELESEEELGVVRTEDGLLVGQLTLLDLAARAANLAQPLHHLVYVSLGALDAPADRPSLVVLDPASQIQAVRSLLGRLDEIAALNLTKHLVIDRGHLHSADNPLPGTQHTPDDSARKPTTPLSTLTKEAKKKPLLRHVQ